MGRKGFWAIGLVVVALLLGCGGKKSTSSKSKNYIRFENEFGSVSVLYITLEACHIQRLELERGSSETLECVPEDGSTSFLVMVEMNPDGVGRYWKQECVVEGGQTVTIKSVGTLNTFYLYVDGEPCSEA